MPFTKAQQIALNKLGTVVKKKRESKSLSLSKLANSIGKEAQSVHRLEMGGVNPSYLYLLDVCKGLDIEISELLDELNKH